MILSLLLALWMWDRTLTDCHGASEDPAYYYFQATIRQVTETTCLDDQGQPYSCTITLPGTPIRFTPDIPDPGTGTTVSTTFDPVLNPGPLLPTPPIGGLSAWPWPSPDNPAPVEAVDTAGNRSMDPCP
jgi:hypothetical protein